MIDPLGYTDVFVEAVDNLTDENTADVMYSELYQALYYYSKLSDDEKKTVDEYYVILCNEIEKYNLQVAVANEELTNAGEVAFAPITVSFAFLGMLWFLIKKKFML